MARNVIISGDHEAFVEAQVAGGQYGSATDVVEAALGMLAERERHDTMLRRLVEQGRASGLSEEDPEAFFDRLEKRYAPEPPRR